MAYSQANRPMRVETGLGEDVLLLAGFSGHEGVSRPFAYHLDLLSEDPAIAPDQVLRKPVTVTIGLGDGSTERKIHGIVSRFTQLDRQEELTSYRAEVVPWLWFLSLSRDCKIFQGLSVLEIVEKVFGSLGYTDYEIRCTKSYPVREYCVQYRETHLAFVSRLLEEEGIFYFFDHSAGKHTLVLTDNSSSAQACDIDSARMGNQAAPDEDVVHSLEREHSVYVGTVTLADYDHLQPSLSLRSSMSGDGKEEIYDYPGKYAALDEGERYARLQLEAEEALRQLVRGSGSCRAFQCGRKFTLEDHYRSDANQPYLLLEVRHSGRSGDYRSWDSTPIDYRNDFLAIPVDVPYRPARRTPKPLVWGSQTALVVGKAGEEIWVDKHGRVKVQFYWDREGKKDENSSCWVRVSTSWAGKGWGTIQIPRIGQEVIVDFLEGDPDRPIITGRVYNAEQTPPFDLPANQTQSGIRSRSSKGGGTDNFNEIRMEDKKGSELLYIHAEKDQEIVVENCRTKTVGADETTSIGANRTESVGKNEQITIDGGRTESVGKDEVISIDGARTESVGKDEGISIGGNRRVTVDKNETLKVSGARNTSIQKDEKLEVSGARKTQIGKDDELNVGKKLGMMAGDQIQIGTGSASITLKKDGTIIIKGKDITISGSGKVNVKASSDVTIKGSQIKQN